MSNRTYFHPGRWIATVLVSLGLVTVISFTRAQNVTGKTTGWKKALNALAMYYGERITKN